MLPGDRTRTKTSIFHRDSLSTHYQMQRLGRRSSTDGVDH